MTPEAFEQAMRDIVATTGIDDGHQMADHLMCELLKSMGYGKGVEVFIAMEKWYS